MVSCARSFRALESLSIDINSLRIPAITSCAAQRLLSDTERCYSTVDKLVLLYADTFDLSLRSGGDNHPANFEMFASQGTHSRVIMWVR